ncbi:unnamed protein product [Meganyctiphanes norvegica]|uniref:ETS domain-containing protein n=1 Tax=Meganyctiphanes norvegica TaxID=48144 RepID=A0AAV2QMJ6_MEGNR
MSLNDGYNTALLQDLSQLEELKFYIGDNIYPDENISSDINMAYSLDESNPEEDSYEYVPVTQWNSKNCIDWGLSVCQEHNLNIFTVDIGGLNNSCGTHLIQSSEADFCAMLGDQCGPVFYREFQEVKKDMFSDIQNRYTNSEEGFGVDQSGYFYDHMGYSPESDTLVSNSEGYDSSQDDFKFNINNSSQNCFNFNTYDSGQESYGYSQNHYDPSLDSYISPVLLSSSPDPSNMYQHSEIWNLKEESVDNIEITSLDAPLHNDQVYQTSEKPQTNTPTPRKVRQRRKKKNNEEVYVSEDMAQKLAGKIPGLSKKTRQPKCWEFLMHLLINEETNPEVVRWEDEANYVFRLVRTDKLVDLWNKKSEFTSHVYDNFARSLRYHYKRNVLIPVPNKQLVYRCGEKAIEYLNKIKNE